VKRDVVANPGNETFTAVVNDEIGIGNPAAQGFGLYRRGPEIQLTYPFAGACVDILSSIILLLCYFIITKYFE
jgi:hypothetical protein